MLGRALQEFGPSVSYRSQPVPAYAPASSRLAARRLRGAPVAALSDIAASSEAVATSSRSSSAAHSAREVYQLSESAVSTSASSAAHGAAGIDPTVLAAVAGLGLTAFTIKRILDTPSRTYDNNVGQEYDAWTEEGVLEYYWGEHIHLGYYSDEELARGYLKKDFKQAKFDFVDEMLGFSGAKAPQKILDVGCGFGGTSRHLAKKFRDASVTGITLSPKQVARGTELAQQQGVTNVKFQVMDALAMDIPDDTYDLVWACESGEHMPDKKKYVEEMTRVLKPGGTLVIACWCQREETPAAPFSPADKADLQFLYDEWAHPYFISIEEFGRLMNGTGKLQAVTTANWNQNTLASWRHSIWVGVFDPWIVISKGPRIWYKTVREIVTIERMHQAFATGLMEYGMMTGTKSLPSAKPADSASDARVPTTIGV
ncbi:putative tocopherol O-methyltransferase, chloroplastic [Tetrabaena socialis]|uniref:Putative tocopherol O-methyltransferase, chloroplastic n=1 Tax=Tetrabaena socialis TaxID=47790 RepID=A0A2J7ZQT2_9CHLO|nr:putative tocopherol O-methyltransferase, chloroplastic [Tetrabaena socialis]|eukprot:PNH02628.1 putative tocopherol O-methyltransferase, chloroplastic [Tetrabaena socialis]